MPRDDDDGGLASVLVIAGIFGGTGCCRPQIVWRPLLSHTGEKPTQPNPPKKKEDRTRQVHSLASGLSFQKWSDKLWCACACFLIDWTKGWSQGKSAAEYSAESKSWFHARSFLARRTNPNLWRKEAAGAKPSMDKTKVLPIPAAALIWRVRFSVISKPA